MKIHDFDSHGYKTGSPESLRKERKGKKQIKRKENKEEKRSGEIGWRQMKITRFN